MKSENDDPGKERPYVSVGTPKRIDRVRAMIENDPEMRADAKRVALDEIISDSSEFKVRNKTHSLLSTHVTDPQDPNYNPGEATAQAAVKVALYLDKETQESLRRGPANCGKGRTKATDENIGKWKDWAKLAWAIELRDDGYKKSDVRQMAKRIANHPLLNTVKASAGTIKNNIVGIKAKVKNPAAEDASLDV